MGQKFSQSWIENSFLNSSMPRSRFKNVIKQSIDFKLFQIKVLLDPGSNLKIVSSFLLCCKKFSFCNYEKERGRGGDQIK